MSTHKLLNIYTDGGARGNPGPAAVGVVIKTETQTLVTFAKTIGVATNNEAEYRGVIAALTWLAKRGVHAEKILFHLDSRLVVEQLSGRFKIKKGELKELLQQVKIFEHQIGDPIYYIQIPRAQNWQADILLNQALDSSTTSSA